MKNTIKNKDLKDFNFLVIIIIVAISAIIISSYIIFHWENCNKSKSLFSDNVVWQWFETIFKFVYNK